MRRKIILSTTVLSIAIALAIFCFGVYASMVQEFTMTNTIGFVSSSNIFLSFDGEISDCKQTMGDAWTVAGTYATKDEYLVAKGFRYTVPFSESNRNNSNLPTSYNWVVTEPIEFINKETSITYKFVLTNYSEVKTKLSLTFKQDGTNIKNAVNCEILSNSKVSSKQPEIIATYTGTQEIVLDEYVIGQSEEPAVCIFYVTTSVDTESSGRFEEENNFTITAEKFV